MLGCAPEELRRWGIGGVAFGFHRHAIGRRGAMRVVLEQQHLVEFRGTSLSTLPNGAMSRPCQS